ncbi:MAG: alanine dehydrogenase, partial [Marinirhabdus sp.]
MTFALIKERKDPPDRRVVFSPEKLKEAATAFPQARFIVEASDIRIFSDQAYRNAGFEVLQDVSAASVMLGVKEVPKDALIPNKKYLFFSHTIKKQPYNRALLQTILDKNIQLYDHEAIVKKNGARLIGFGRYAGLVGAYNGFRALGMRDGIFALPKAATLADLGSVKAQLDKISLPALKIVLSGKGKVARGAKEILDYLGIKEVGSAVYLNSRFDGPVYCHVHV